MPDDKQCRKCNKKESQSNMPWMSVYGLCNECHGAFLPYLHRALERFLKLKIIGRRKVSISWEEKNIFAKKHYSLMKKALEHGDRLAIKEIASLARIELGYAESTVPCDILSALKKAYV